MLSKYEPPSSRDNSYAQSEAQYSQYKKELDERYPQVCRQCEPRVRERIQQTGYAAKTDHLRRLMERSRRRRIAYRWGWRSLVVSAGGFAQLLSFITYTGWTCAVVSSGLQENSMFDIQSNTVLSCSWTYARTRHVLIGCIRPFSDLAGLGLLFGLVSIWWNPQWQYKLQENDGRLRGLTRYYRVQALGLLVRFGVWVVSHDFEVNGPRTLWALHVVTAPLLFLLMVILLTTVRVDKTPVVSWKMDVPPLTQTSNSVVSGQGDSSHQLSENIPSYASASAGQSIGNHFQISDLAPKVPQRRAPEIPPSPSGSAVDEMEWEPSQSHNFNPTTYADRYPQKVVQPSPFHGRLPPAPTNFFISRSAQAVPPPKDSIGLAPGHFDRPQGIPEEGQLQSAPDVFAQPTFNPAMKNDTDTGLETIFGKFFQLGEDPLLTTTQGASQDSSSPADIGSENLQSMLENDSSIKSHSTVHLVAAFLLIIILAAWLSVDLSGGHGKTVKLILAHATTIAFASLSVSTWVLPYSSTSCVVGYYVMTLISTWLTGHRLQGGYADGGNLDHCVTALLAMMTIVELSLNSSATSAKSVQVSAAQSSGNPPIASEQQHWQNEIANSGHPVQSEHAPTISATTPPPTKIAPSFISSTSSFDNRPRNDSLDSSTSDSDTGSVTSTVTSTSVQTPGFRYGGGNRGQSPGFGLGSLQLDDSTGSTTSSRYGTRRNLRSNGTATGSRYGRNY